MRNEEIEFFKFLQKEKIQTVVDVGSNIGDYTNEVLKFLKPINICCIEPINSCFLKLKDRFINNKNITIINKLISSKKETVSFNEAIGNEEHSSIVDRSWLYNNGTYNIVKRELETEKLDNIFVDTIDLLKIDTEGYELEVLKGCEKLLQENKIKYIQFEYGGCFKDNNIKLNDVIEYLNVYDYKVFKLINSEFIEIQTYKDDYQWINYFAFKK